MIVGSNKPVPDGTDEITTVHLEPTIQSSGVEQLSGVKRTKRVSRLSLKKKAQT